MCDWTDIVAVCVSVLAVFIASGLARKETDRLKKREAFDEFLSVLAKLSVNNDSDFVSIVDRAFLYSTKSTQKVIEKYYQCCLDMKEAKTKYKETSTEFLNIKKAFLQSKQEAISAIKQEIKIKTQNDEICLEEEEKSLVFVERLLDLLKKNKKTEKQFITDLNFNKSAVWNWKKGTTKSYMDRIDEIADYFNVSVDYLLGREKALDEIGLLSEEKELIRCFRALGNDGQSAILRAARNEYQAQGSSEQHSRIVESLKTQGYEADSKVSQR